MAFTTEQVIAMARLLAGVDLLPSGHFVSHRFQNGTGCMCQPLFSGSISRPADHGHVVPDPS
jgi:hypothetical protein